MIVSALIAMIALWGAALGITIKEDLEWRKVDIVTCEPIAPSRPERGSLITLDDGRIYRVQEPCRNLEYQEKHYPVKKDRYHRQPNDQ